MFRQYQLIASCFAIVGLSTAAVAASARARRREVVKVTDLHPFTHVANIPADAHLSSIRMEGVRAVKVATRRRSVTDTDYCGYVSRFAEPGGSMFCPQVTNEAQVPAYRVSYSYQGQPMASDEYARTSFTFSVYFRPGELNPGLLKALSAGSVSRSTAAEFFQITTSRGSVYQTVIDKAKSTFCKGTYLDASWIHTDPKCEDVVAYKVIEVPSPFITVKVTPVFPHVETAGLRRQAKPR
jgi:hypothetical protein